jgi:hypothetical protein
MFVDIEWLLSTLFDASLYNFEPPAMAALFFPHRPVPFRAGFRRRAVNHGARNFAAGSARMCLGRLPDTGQSGNRGRAATMSESFAF